MKNVSPLTLKLQQHNHYHNFSIIQHNVVFGMLMKKLENLFSKRKTKKILNFKNVFGLIHMKHNLDSG